MRHTDIAFQAASAAAIICVGLCAVKVQACWTECEGCQTYDEELGYCVDDHSKCGSHYCENSICVECLVDDHCDMCKYCRPASRTCQDIYVESLHVLFSDVLCVGGATEFAASTFPWGKECQLSWDHEGASEVQGECGWTWARWTQPGVYTVTAGCGENSQSVQITVVGVQSIEVNKEAVCWNDPNGILFEAIPDPNGPMTCLQWEGRRKSDINDPWGQWGMVGWECYNPPAGGFWCPTIRLATPIPGYYQFRARNGQDGSWSESPVVKVVKVDVEPQPHSPLGPGRICANAQADFRKAPWKAVVQPVGTTATVTVSGAASIGSGSIAVSDGEIIYPQSIDEETVGGYTVYIVHDDSGDCPVTEEEQVFKFYIEGPSLLSDKTEAKAYGLPFSYDKDMLNIYANAIHPGAPMNGGELTAFYGFKILAYPEIYSGAVEAQIRANASAPGQITIYKEEPPGGSITLGVSIDILFVQASVSETIDPDNLGAGLASTNLGLYFLDKTAEHGPYYKSHEDIAGPYPGGWKMGEWGYELNVHISTGTEPFTVGNQINLSNKIGVGSIIGEEDTVLVTCNQRCIGNVTIELETIRIPILD